MTLIKEVRDIVKQPSTPPLGHYVNMPYVRNRSFFDRPLEMTLLDQCLEKNRELPSTIQCAALVGFGGAGKTQLAAEYLHRFMKNYEIILWCEAASLAKLSGSCFTHAKALGLLQEDSRCDSEQAIRLIKQWLFRCSRGCKWFRIGSNTLHTSFANRPQQRDN